MTTMTLADVRGRLRRLADPDRAAVFRRFFQTGPGQYGEGDQFLGIQVPPVRALAKECHDLAEADVLALLRSPLHEERLLALLVLVSQYARGDEAARKRIHDLYLVNTLYVNNWDLVDTSAEYLVGAHLSGKRALGLLDRLAGSASVWERRIAVVATFHFIKQAEFGPTVRVAERLLADGHDLIHKAVGWMLREVGKRDGAALRAFLDAHAGRMPRTALRYAIERFAEAERRKYLGMGKGRGARPAAGRPLE